MTEPCATKNLINSHLTHQEARMIFYQEVKKWATDLHIFLHKAEEFLSKSNSVEHFVSNVFENFEQKPQFLSNDEAEEMLVELWAAHTDGRLA
jgi:hypothetical protein